MATLGADFSATEGQSSRKGSFTISETYHGSQYQSRGSDGSLLGWSQFSESSSRPQSSTLTTVSKPPKPSKVTWSFREALEQVFRVNSLRALSAWIAQRRGERVKPIVLRRRLFSLLHNTVHIVPITIVICLIGLNFHSVYIGAPGTWVQILQFAAKAHEVAMQASISVILVAYLRHELLGEGRVPLGAIFPVLQIHQLSSLWSAELWATITAKHFRRPRMWIFVLLVIFSALLAASVGPASAIAMIPRQMDYPYGNVTTIYNITSDVINPMNFKNGRINPNCSDFAVIDELGAPNCPASDWRAVCTLVNEPEYVDSVPVSKQHFTTNLYQFTLDKEETESGIDSFSALTTTESAAHVKGLYYAMHLWQSARNLSSQMWLVEKNIFALKTNIKMPYVEVNCGSAAITEDSNLDDDVVFGSNTASHPGYSRHNPPFKVANIIALMNSTTNHTVPTVHWEEPEDPRKSNTSLLAIVLQPRTPNGTVFDGWYTDETSGPRNVMLCRIVAAWIDTSIEMNSLGATGASQSLLTFQRADLERAWRANVNTVPKIALTPTWAGMLFPTEDGNPVSPIQEQLLQDTWSEIPSNETKYSDAVSDPSYAFAGLVAAGLANTEVLPAADDPRYTGRQLKPTHRNATRMAKEHGQYTFLQMLSSDAGGLWYYSGSGQKRRGPYLERFASPPAVLTADFQVKGLAYSMHGVGIKLSITILTLYCAFAMSYLIYSTWFGVSSTAWDSMGEMTVLALNSDRPSALENASTGIETLETFRQPISIRAREGYGAQIVFEEDERSDRGEKGYERILPNKDY